MPTYQYGEIFAKLGVPNMGQQGVGWCGIDPSGVLVLMSHQNFYHLDKETKRYFYDAVPVEKLADSSPSAKRSLQMVRAYFAPGKPVLLPIGVFNHDGGPRSNGSIKPASFDYATGAVYRATFRHFTYDNGHTICDVVERFEV